MMLKCFEQKCSATMECIDSDERTKRDRIGEIAYTSDHQKYFNNTKCQASVPIKIQGEKWQKWCAFSWMGTWAFANCGKRPPLLTQLSWHLRRCWKTELHFSFKVGYFSIQNRDTFIVGNLVRKWSRALLWARFVQMGDRMAKRTLNIKVRESSVTCL